MTRHHARWVTLGAILLAGCSFIDDWGSLRRTADAGTRDGGGHDGGRDSGMCEQPSCDCASDEVCVEVDGCPVCVACDPCAGCGTQCVAIDVTQQLCYCEHSRIEGEVCDFPEECMRGLSCQDGACRREVAREGESCAARACAAGLDCVDSVCRQPCVSSGECSAAYPDCEAGYCRGSSGGEWEPCGSGSSCDVGLECRDIGGTGFTLCFRPCNSDADCPSAEHTHCQDIEGDGLLECAPPSGCNFVYGTGCAPDRTCGILYIGMPEAEGYCFFTRGTPQPAGGPCGEANGCEPGSACFSDGVSGTCMRLCFTDESACLGGQTCNPVGIPYMAREVGVCM